MVCAAKNKETSAKVAIKKITPMCASAVDGESCTRRWAQNGGALVKVASARGPQSAPRHARCVCGLTLLTPPSPSARGRHPAQARTLSARCGS